MQVTPVDGINRVVWKIGDLFFVYPGPEDDKAILVSLLVCRLSLELAEKNWVNF